MAETEIIAQKLGIVLDKFFKVVEFLSSRTIAWQNYLRIMESRDLLQKYNRKWSALKKARELGYFLAQNIERFERERSSALDYIRTNNPRLGEKIAKFKPTPENTRLRLGALLVTINQNKAMAISYIKTHSKELISWVDSIEYEKIKTDLKRLIIGISGDEISELNKCIADLERWQSLRIGNNISFFKNRVFVYLRGGRLENQDFFGLIRYFKDKSFINEIKNSYALRMLLNYQKQVEFFENARKIIAYAMWKPGWEGFRGPNGWFNNLKKGENYIDKVRNVFGNKEIADRLEQMYETTGEYPEGWLRNIDAILARIKHPSYQNTYVIIPAANDLLNILEKKLRELLGENIESKIDKLRRIVTRDFESSIRKSRNLRIFNSILNSELRMLETETEKEKMTLKNLLTTNGESVLNFIEAANSLIASSEEDTRKKIAAFLRLKIMELKILRGMKNLKGGSDDPRRSVTLYSILLKYDKRINEIDRWVELVKLSGLSALKYEANEIETALKREEVLNSSASTIDRQLSIVKDNYFILRKNEREMSIMDADYLEMPVDNMEKEVTENA